MLKKENRLTKNRYFNFIYRKGSKFYAHESYLVVTKTKFLFNKYGFAVSSKIGNAVVRNKVKRRLRSIVRELGKNVKQKVNCIIVARVGIEKLSYKEMKNQVDYLFKKSGIYEPKNN